MNLGVKIKTSLYRFWRTILCRAKGEVVLHEDMLSSAWALLFRRWTLETHQNRGSKAIVLITMCQWR